jgi:hypothetical protein
MVLLAFGLVAAVVAAAAKQALAALSDEGWAWQKFLEDVVTNGLIATLVAAGTSAIHRYQRDLERRREHNRAVLLRGATFALAANGWSWLPSDGDELPRVSDKTIRELETVSEDCRQIADAIDSLTSTELETNKQRVAAWATLDGLHWPLARYIGEGGRVRRLIYIGQLSVDLAPLEASSDEQLAATARRFRARAMQLAAVGARGNRRTLRPLRRAAPAGRGDLPRSALPPVHPHQNDHERNRPKN